MVHVQKHVEEDQGLNNDHAKIIPRQTNAVDRLLQLNNLQRTVIRMGAVRNYTLFIQIIIQIRFCDFIIKFQVIFQLIGNHGGLTVHVLKHVEKEQGLKTDRAKIIPRLPNAVDRLLRLKDIRRTVIRMIAVSKYSLFIQIII